MQHIMVNTAKTDVSLLRDEEIVPYILEGKKELYEVIMRRHNQRLYRIAVGLGVQEGYREDVLQETYLSAYKNLARFKGESLFSTWLIRILINNCRMHLRRQKTKSHQSMEDISGLSLPAAAEDHADRHLVKLEIENALKKAIDKMGNKLRTVFIMRELEKLSIKETADALQLTEANVKVLLHRARQQMKELLHKELGEPELYVFGQKHCDRVVGYVMKAIAEL